MTDILGWVSFDTIEFWNVRTLFVFGAILVGGFLRGFVGFGAALVIIPTVSIIYGPREAVALHAVVEVPALFRLVPIAVQHADRKLVVPLIIGITVLMPVGTWFLAFVDPNIMRVVIALIVLALVALIASNWRYKGRIGPPAAFSTGAVSGLIQGAAGTGGPPVIAVLLSRPDSPDTIRGNILAALAALHVVAVFVLAAYGIFTKDIIVLGILAAPAFLLAIGFGTRHYDRGGNRYYRRAALIVLACVALVSLYSVATS